MSFAASTAPGSKHQFLSSHKRGGRQKIITPRNQQLPSLNKDDQIKKASTPTTDRSHKHAKATKANATDKEKKSKNHDRRTPRETSMAKDHAKSPSENVDSQVDTVAGNDLWITSKSKYDEMVFLKQRHELRIKSLEADLQEVLQYYEMLYKENENLKEKLNLDEQLVAEPYKTIYNDRGVLRTAEFTYRKRIAQLEKEVKDSQKETTDLKEEIKLLKTKLPNMDKEREKDAKYNKTFWENRNLKTENHGLIKKIEMLTEDIKFYTTQKGPDWEADFISAREVLLDRSESAYGNDQHFAIFEHEAKRIVAELEEHVENLTTTTRYLTKKNKQVKKDYEDAAKKNEELTEEKKQLEREFKLLKYRLGETKNSKTTDKGFGKYDHAKLLYRFKESSAQLQYLP